MNATSAGVKPGNSTDKNTSCKTGRVPEPRGRAPGASARRDPPDSSKRYGNDDRCPDRDERRRARRQLHIRGPGNSQPHKVCGKNGHFIDVHAVKSYVGLDCTATAAAPTTATTATQQQSQATVATSSTSSTSANRTEQLDGRHRGHVADRPDLGHGRGRRVAGVSAESGSPQSGGSNPDAGGVLGAFGVAGVAAGGALPFTGFPLWLVVLAAIALIAIGWTLHRRGRPASRDLV